MNKISLLLMAFLMWSLQAMAQQFTTHAVKQGETLYGIAKKYRVTPYNILKFNKELKKDAPLQPNTVLVIPLDAKAAGTTVQPSKMVKPAAKLQDSVKQPEPVDYKTHRVRRKETLFGIAQRYQISEEDIKRYNTQLYASQLKKGMRLQIPIFPIIPEDENALNEEDFETYLVQSKETRWSIAHTRGITIDSLLALNPELPRANNYLAEGQELIVPKIAGSSVDNQEVQLFISYTVPAKKTLYSLGNEYGIDSAEIVRLNPEIMEQGGLKEGMVIRLPKKKVQEMTISTENYVFYEVKPKQTTYSLTRNLGIGYGELLDLNPDLVNGLKAGMVLKLPREKASGLEVRNSLVMDKINLLDSINPVNKPKLLFMLPFRLDRLNLSDTEATSRAIESRNDIRYSLGLYSGAMIALDSIASLGISVDVKTYDTELSLEKAKKILLSENLNEINAIIGPLDPKSLNEVAVQAASYQIPVIAPVPFVSDLSLNNVFFSYTSDEVLRNRMIAYIEEQRTDEPIVIIADDKNQLTKELLLEKFPEAKSIPVLEEEKNISIDIEAFTELLSEEKENWVFVESENFKLVSSVISILNSANTVTKKVRMFTTNKNRAFDNAVISGSHLSSLKFTYPSVFREVGNDGFVKKYSRKFGSVPDKYAVRGFDLTYDLLLKLAYKLNLFEASRLVGITEYTGNKFDYSKDLVSGYFNNGAYIMMYNDMRIKEANP